MAKDLKTKERFIELRAEGLSFIRISKELKVSKPTLIRWQTELAREVSAAKFARYEMLIEQYSLMRQHRISHFGELLGRILDELRKRDLMEVPTDKLVGMALTVDSKLRAEITSIVHEEPPAMDLSDLTSPKRIHID